MEKLKKLKTVVKIFSGMIPEKFPELFNSQRKIFGNRISR